MKKVLNRNFEAGTRKNNDPRLVGSIVSEMLQGWNRNTDLSVDLKTVLHSDLSMKTGKEYQGVLRRDSDIDYDDYRCHDAHYTFIETVPPTPRKRNPHVFVGKYITVTRKDDGSLRLNFRPLKTGKGFNVSLFAVGVSNELLWALEGLVEERR